MFLYYSYLYFCYLVGFHSCNLEYSKSHNNLEIKYIKKERLPLGYGSWSLTYGYFLLFLDYYSYYSQRRSNGITPSPYKMNWNGYKLICEGMAAL